MGRRTFTTAAVTGDIELLEYRSGSRCVNIPRVRPIDGQERIQEVGTMGISRDGVTGQAVLKVPVTVRRPSARHTGGRPSGRGVRYLRKYFSGSLSKATLQPWAQK
jgi:hypothetical protein